MNHRTSALQGYRLAASDGEFGKVTDFYFDDRSWVVRYLVADTGSWLTGRQVLVSPHAFGTLDTGAKLLHLNLTRSQIEKSPSIETHKPVSRQYETEYYNYYGWPMYWNGGGMWGLGDFPVLVPPSKDELAASGNHRHRAEKHLQSAQSVRGYHIQAVDGAIGEVTGFLVDDRSWAIRELAVEAGHWFAGKEILIAPERITRISYEQSKVFVDLTKADIEGTMAHRVVEAGSGAAAEAAFPRE